MYNISKMINEYYWQILFKLDVGNKSYPTCSRFSGTTLVVANIVKTILKCLCILYIFTDDSTVVKRMLLNDNKAGMEGLDKDKINQIIHEASKGDICSCSL